MKKILFIFLITISLLLVGCQSAASDTTVQNPNNESPSNNPEPTYESIGVRSLAQLSEMREMIACTDEDELNRYLLSVEGGSAYSREDLAKFVALVDSLPLVELIDGNITWISYSYGYGSSGKYSEIMYISTEAENGDWTRLEYILSVSDVSGEITKQTEELAASSVLPQPIQTADGKMTVFSETREAHVSGTGDTITWIADIDGIYTRVVYYTADADTVNTANLYGNLSLTALPTEENQ